MTNKEYAAIKGVLALIWIVTGILSLGVYPLESSLTLLHRLPVDREIAIAFIYAGAGLDLLMGMLILLRPGKRLWQVQFLVVAGYTFLATFLVPELWLHPFGPLLKNASILVLLWLLINRREVA